MTYAAEHTIAMPPRRTARRPGRRTSARLPRCRDERWPEVVSALTSLRARNRRSIRIVDADCGAGILLLCAVRLARYLGFTAIEARGIGDTPALVERARTAAGEIADPAIGITFERADLLGALDSEDEFPADIVVWHGCRNMDVARARNVERAVRRAGHALISDAARRGRAA